MSPDVCTLIINKIKKCKGNNDNNFALPRGTYSYVSKALGINKPVVKSVWTRYCQTGGVEYLKVHSGGGPRKTGMEHERYVDYLLTETPSLSLGEIQEKLDEMFDIKLSKMTVHRLVKRSMTRKRLVRPATARFDDENVRYSNVFLRVIRNKNYRSLKFFDESSFAVPDVCNPRYGHARKGERAIEVNRLTRSRSVTLNLMIGADGVSYFNLQTEDRSLVQPES